MAVKQFVYAVEGVFTFKKDFGKNMIFYFHDF